jgi:hypothetical protein
VAAPISRGVIGPGLRRRAHCRRSERLATSRADLLGARLPRVLSLRLSGRVGCCCRCWPGAASLNSRLASNLQQAIIHTRSSAERAEPSRAEPVHTLPPRRLRPPLGPGFAAGLGSACLRGQARWSAGRTCQPVRSRRRTRHRSGGNRLAHRHPRFCPCRGTRLLALDDKLITARRCQPPARRPRPGRSPTR